MKNASVFGVAWGGNGSCRGGRVVCGLSILGRAKADQLGWAAGPQQGRVDGRGRQGDQGDQGDHKVRGKGDGGNYKAVRGGGIYNKLNVIHYVARHGSCFE